MRRHNSLRQKFFCATAIGALSLTGAAFAQTETAETEDDAPPTRTQTDEPEARQERITVTGSLIRRDEFTSPSPIQVITADVAALEGLVNSAEILQGSSLAAGSTQLNNQRTGFITEGGTGVQTVDLRGCGGVRTLVLVNGKRPGPAGTRGQVGVFDLNVIPSSIVQRFDILKDSGSTIYGSDAVCGVVNIITNTSVDRPQLSVTYNAPFESGGESFSVSGATGFRLGSNGSLALAAEYFEGSPLRVGQRSYLECSEDLVTDLATGERRDRVNRSVTAANDPRGCSDIYFNTVIDNVTGQRLVPSPDGVTGGTSLGGIVPGYRPRQNAGFTAAGPAFYEDVLVDDLQQRTTAIAGTERLSIYATTDLDFDFLGGVNWQTEFLYNNRKTSSDGVRQFFPQIRGLGTALPASITRYALSPTFENPLNSVYQPVAIWNSDDRIDVDYYYVGSGFDGSLQGLGLETWGWQLGANYTYSSGDYSNNQIVASRSGDYSAFGPNGSYSLRRDSQGNPILDRRGFAQVTPIAGSGAAPTYNTASPEFLSGTGSGYDQAYDLLNEYETGNTVYEQYLINGNVTGKLFDLPAGAVQAAVGFEYRDFRINDIPGQLTRGEVINVTDPLTGTAYLANVADVWGRSTSGQTKGRDRVTEVFGEIDVPLLKGAPFAEEVTFSASGRAFDYDSFGTDSVYKLGLNWQVNPSVRLRTTYGTAFRAPALFELFLDAQTGFVGQTAIDPCINLQDQSNERIINNCTSLGIPLNYTGIGASATVISGGGAGNLESETSDSFSVGFIFTPTFADVSIAIDYYEIEVRDQIAQLGAQTIVSGCFAGENFPNQFCNLFIRAPGDSPGNAFNILTVENAYLNVNKQTFRGLDLNLRYDREFDFGRILTEGDISWAFEREQQLFAPGTVEGFDFRDVNGQLGFPSVSANLRTTLVRGDFRYTWFSDFVGNSSNERFSTRPGGFEEPYFGALVTRDYNAEAVIYHGLSAEYRTDTWRVLAGVRNVFDEHPPTVSGGAATRRGNVPFAATQYDLRGRTGFVRVSRTF